MIKRIHHLALRTRDPGRVERFYGEILGLTPRRRDAARGTVWLEADGVILMIEPAGPDEPAPPAGTLDLLAFAIDDTAEWRTRLRDAGVAIESETAYTLYFRDPDGRRVGLSTYRF